MANHSTTETDPAPTPVAAGKLTARDAAHVVGVSERTIRRAIARGDLPATKHAGVYRIDRNDLAAYRPGAVASGPASPTLRQMPTALIGRTTETATIRALLLREGARLVTLTGPGGVGKTHLSLQVAHDIADVFADGGVFVDLSPLHDSRLVLPAIAQAIGMRDTGRADLDTAVAAFLTQRDLLLVLDNCEQVIDAAPQIAAILAACPGLRILATSRAPFRVRGERRFPLDPLPVPPVSHDGFDRVTQTASVQLFLERARAVHPAMKANDENLQAIAGICRRLDGLPLAIELAAAWSALLSPGDLLAQLPDRMRTRGRELRDLPDRQRTVRDTIDWSYHLLPAGVARLFRSLAVFTGGFDLDAAMAIAGEDSAVVVEDLGVLEENSLLRRVERPGTTARYAFLETIREFATVEAIAHGEMDGLRHRHAAYYVDLSRRVVDVLYSSRMSNSLDILEAEYPNFLAALDWFIETGDATREVILVSMLAEYWDFRGQLHEGIAALRAALGRAAAVPPGWRAKAMTEIGYLLWTANDIDTAIAWCDAAEALAREVSTPWLSQVMFVRGRVHAAKEGHEDLAISILDDVCERITGIPSEVPLYATARADLGVVWLRKGDRQRGNACLHQALDLYRSEGVSYGIATVLVTLARQERESGTPGRAATLLAEALRAFRDAGTLTQVGTAQAELAALALAQGSVVTVGRLAGMMDAIVIQTGAVFEMTSEVARALDQPGFQPVIAPARESGRAVPFADALTETIAIADSLAVGNPVTGPMRHTSHRAPGRLSSREQHVLVLLSQRYTASEIADQLFLSVRTVERHVSNIYNKLGVNSRRAAIAAANRYGLV